MPEEGNKDDFVTAGTLEEKARELEVAVPDAKKAEEAGVLDTVRGAFSTVAGGVGKAWSTLGEWRDTETPLRKMFKTARLELDDAAAKARDRTTGRQTEMRECMQKMTKDRKARFQELDKSGALTKCMELKKQHPELVVGGFTLAVALPSALAGKRAFFRNGARALVLSSAVVYGGAWMKRRGLTPPQLAGKDDSRASGP